MTGLGNSPLLSIVIIGRNEGNRLERCLQSVRNMNNPGGDAEVIYVDSASTDGSPEVARRFGAWVIPLIASRFTAALARNGGWRVSSGRFVMFLDGDTVLDPCFVVESLPDFESDTAVVWGNRREIHPGASVYNRILDLEWISVAGIVDSCGGDALIRREALEAVNGYDEALIAGEEPEMCRRMRAAGWKIRHVDRPMTGHDLAMYRCSQYWRRSVRTGYAYAEVSERFQRSALPLWDREARHNRSRALALAGLFALAAVWSLARLSFWPLALLALFIALLSLRTALKAAWKSPSFSTRLLYGLHSHLQQIPIYIGQLQYHMDRRRRSRRGLIEYKGTAS